MSSFFWEFFKFSSSKSSWPLAIIVCRSSLSSSTIFSYKIFYARKRKAPWRYESMLLYESKWILLFFCKEISQKFSNFNNDLPLSIVNEPISKAIESKIHLIDLREIYNERWSNNGGGKWLTRCFPIGKLCYSLSFSFRWQTRTRCGRAHPPPLHIPQIHRCLFYEANNPNELNRYEASLSFHQLFCFLTFCIVYLWLISFEKYSRKLNSFRLKWPFRDHMYFNDVWYDTVRCIFPLIYLITMQFEWPLLFWTIQLMLF